MCTISEPLVCFDLLCTPTELEQLTSHIIVCWFYRSARSWPSFCFRLLLQLSRIVLVLLFLCIYFIIQAWFQYEIKLHYMYVLAVPTSQMWGMFFCFVFISFQIQAALIPLSNWTAWHVLSCCTNISNVIKIDLRLFCRERVTHL